VRDGGAQAGENDSVTLAPPSGEWPKLWRFDAERVQEDGKVVFRRKGSAAQLSSGGRRMTDTPLQGSGIGGATRALAVARSAALKDLLFTLSDAVIYDPKTPALRGLSAGEPLDPIGLDGSGLAPALKTLQTPEGALYVLFAIALLFHPHTPRLFGVEGLDHALHPRLARALVRMMGEHVAASGKQIVLTTHNPLVLDGLALAKQAQGFHPDLNDGIRQNIRPFLLAGDVGKKGAGLFRSVPLSLKDKDKGTEPERPKKDYPWFWCEEEPGTDPPGGKEFVGSRWNGVHLTLARKRASLK
jgi:hypothetical protein